MTARSWLPPDAIDTRIVFWLYAVAVGLGGVLLFLWGPGWIADDPRLIRAFGGLLIVAACCAVGFARVEDPPSRHRGMFWFAAAHWMAIPTMFSQFDVAQLKEWGAGVVILTFYGLLYSYLAAGGGAFEPVRDLLPTTLFRKQQLSLSERVRAPYEQQIRQVARQEERNRLARDLHDSIKQQVFVIQTAAATAQVRFHKDPDGASTALQQVRDSAREAMTGMEAMLDQLQAAPLENTGLIAAIRKQCEALGHRTGAQVQFEIGELPVSRVLAPGTHEAFLRVAQEALANVGRHARASHVKVSLAGSRDQVVLTVWDNGSGFFPLQTPGGMGIRNMRQRAEEFGGSFEVNSRPGNGALVRLALPFKVRNVETHLHAAIASGGVAVAIFAYAVWKGPGFLMSMAVLCALAGAHMALTWFRLRHEATR